MGNLVNQANEAYNTWKSSIATTIDEWDKATDAQIVENFRTEQKFKQAIVDAQDIESSFYAARTEAFAQLERDQVAARVALQNVWQLKEDAGFDVDA